MTPRPLLSDQGIDFPELDGVEETLPDFVQEALSMYRCPYYRGEGICTTGCRTEPACQTGEPTEGWVGLIEAHIAETPGLGKERTS